MRKLHLLSLLLFLCSCSDPCEGLECLSEDGFAFTIKSKSSGNDLIFGDKPQFSKDDVEVYYMVNGTKETAYVFHDYNIISVSLNREVQVYFVDALSKTDTLNVQFYSRPASECCPSTTEIERITVNGKEVDQDTWIINLFR